MLVLLGGESSSSLTNHISMLAKNQSLLTVLQKNLSSPNLPASIKSLAARVLASPLGRAPGISRFLHVVHYTMWTNCSTYHVYSNVQCVIEVVMNSLTLCVQLILVEVCLVG